MPVPISDAGALALLVAERQARVVPRLRGRDQRERGEAVEQQLLVGGQEGGRVERRAPRRRSDW